MQSVLYYLLLIITLPCLKNIFLPIINYINLKFIFEFLVNGVVLSADGARCTHSGKPFILKTNLLKLNGYNPNIFFVFAFVYGKDGLLL